MARRILQCDQKGRGQGVLQNLIVLSPKGTSPLIKGDGNPGTAPFTDAADRDPDVLEPDPVLRIGISPGKGDAIFVPETGGGDSAPIQPVTTVGLAENNTPHPVIRTHGPALGIAQVGFDRLGPADQVGPAVGPAGDDDHPDDAHEDHHGHDFKEGKPIFVGLHFFKRLNPHEILSLAEERFSSPLPR